MQAAASASSKGARLSHPRVFLRSKNKDFFLTSKCSYTRIEKKKRRYELLCGDEFKHSTLPVFQWDLCDSTFTMQMKAKNWQTGINDVHSKLIFTNI